MRGESSDESPRRSSGGITGGGGMKSGRQAARARHLSRAGRIRYDVGMRLSARNQLPGTVVEIHEGAVTTTVKVTLEGDATMTSSITKEAADELGLAVGSAVVVVVKASDVMIGVN